MISKFKSILYFFFFLFFFLRTLQNNLFFIFYKEYRIYLEIIMNEKSWNIFYFQTVYNLFDHLFFYLEIAKKKNVSLGIFSILFC